MLGASLDGVRVHREWEQVYLQDTYGVYALTSTLADLPRFRSVAPVDDHRLHDAGEAAVVYSAPLD